MPQNHPEIPAKYPLLVELDDVQLYVDKPIVLDEARRSSLDALRTPMRAWAWFVHSTREVSKGDYRKLSRATK